MSKDHANMSPANYAEGNGMYASKHINYMQAVTENVDDTNEIQLYKFYFLRQLQIIKDDTTNVARTPIAKRS